MNQALLVLASVLLLPSIAHASPSAISFDPAEPSAGESITITFTGSESDACWSLADEVCGSLQSNEIVIEADLFDCWGQPCGACLTVIFDYRVDCVIPGLAAGQYTVRGLETRDSLRRPGQDQIEKTLTVRPTTATEPSTWSKIRSLF